MASKSDLDYYKAADDYHLIKDYLDLTPVEAAVEESGLPEFQPDYSTAIVVDCIPKGGPEKIAKIMAVILKVYRQVNPESPVTADDVYLPFDESTNMSLGFCFIKFPTAADADRAISLTQGFALDVNHVFKVSKYGELDKYSKVSEDDAPPTLADFHPKPEVASWLTDPHCRDQFSVRYGRETEIYWANGTGEEPNLVYGGENEKKSGKYWCEMSVEWSPQGTYFVTFHKPGVKLWGSKEFAAQGRFMHPSVEEISFSPCENYLITYRTTDLPGTNPNEAIIVWDVRTGEKLRSFPLRSSTDVGMHVLATIQELKPEKKVDRTAVSSEEKPLPPQPRYVERLVRGKVRSISPGTKATGPLYTIEEGNIVHENLPASAVQGLQDPNKLKWSADGRYVARLGVDLIYVFELPTMALLQQKSIGANNVLEFAWSPRSNMISYWSPAVPNHPALINLIRIPDRESVCSRKLFDVTDVHMVWQNDGDYLCSYMTKNSGKKRTFVLMFFRLNAPGIPVEQLEQNEPVQSVSWEPSGDRCIILSGDQRSPTLSVYSMSGPAASAATTAPTKVVGGAWGQGKAAVAATPKAELTLLFTKSSSQSNNVQWSPAGGVVALAYMAPDACIFELLDVDSNTVLATRRHDRCAKIAWDPSGRYLATCTITDLRNTNAKGNPDDGVNFYTFQGNLVCQLKREKLHSFLWRPRPRDLLSPEERKKVIKNLRKYEKIFEKEDRARKDELAQELHANRYRVAKNFLEWMHANQARSAELKPKRVALRSGYDSDDERNYEIEIITA